MGVALSWVEYGVREVSVAPPIHAPLDLRELLFRRPLLRSGARDLQDGVRRLWLLRHRGNALPRMDILARYNLPPDPSLGTCLRAGAGGSGGGGTIEGDGQVEEQSGGEGAQDGGDKDVR